MLFSVKRQLQVNIQVCRKKKATFLGYLLLVWLKDIYEIIYKTNVKTNSSMEN